MSPKRPIDQEEDLSGEGSGIADQSLQPTSASAWGKAAKEDEGLIAELPSGNVCKLRRTMDMMTMLQAGRIPNPLASIVESMISTGSLDFGGAAQEAGDPEVVRQLFDLLNQTMAQAFVEPPVSAPDRRGSDESWSDYTERTRDWKPKRGTLSALDIEMEDKMFVFAVAQGAAADLDRFRAEQESIMESLQPKQKVVKPTKRTTGSKSKK